MKALVVYESMYGNTARVGEAIAESLRQEGLEVAAGPVSHVDPARAAGVDLLVVGGPTHVHGLSTAASRKTAAADAKNTFAEPTVDPGLRAWLRSVPRGSADGAAAFDTRIDQPALLTGSAAKGIGRRLRARGFRVLPSASFLVTPQNELVDGEVERAGQWARALAAGAVREAVTT